MPDQPDSRREFDLLVNRARKAGILRFCHEGIAVLAVEDAPPQVPPEDSKKGGQSGTGKEQGTPE
jgi:hypothetical protein